MNTDVPALLFAVLAFLVGAVVPVAWNGWTTATRATLLDSLQGGLVTCGLAVLWFIWNLYRSAEAAYIEKRADVERLEHALERNDDANETKTRLVQLRHEGYQLRNKKVPGVDASTWIASVNVWQSNVLSVLDDKISAKELSQLQVVGNLPNKVFIWAKDPKHLKRLRKLDVQLEVLTEIMGKF